MSANSKAPVILITGCSSGLGRELALASAKRNLRVIATARKIESIEDLKSKGTIEILPLDVSASVEELQKFAEKALSIYGTVDILVNNAGYLLAGAIEESGHEENLALFNTLFFGLVNLTDVFLPYMRQERKGTIINISSQGGCWNLPGCGIYCAAKAAVDSISDTWSRELNKFGIRVTAIQLGGFRTSVGTSGNLKVAGKKIGDYQEVHNMLDGYTAQAGSEKGDVRKASDRILKLATDGGPIPARLPIGDDAVEIVGDAYKRHAGELEKWKSMSIGTNHDD